MSTTRDEQVVSDYLQPLNAIEPGRRRGTSQHAGWYGRYAGYAVIALGAFALVALIALLASHRSASEKPVQNPPSGRGVFAKTSGWITTGGTGTGLPISALDPAHSGLATRVI